VLIGQHLKRSRILVVITIVASILVVSSGFASARVDGQGCKKVGIQRVVAGTRFVCRKTGKRLVWQAQKAAKVSPAQSANLWTAQQNAAVGIDRCRLPDRRDPSLINAPRSLGFPLDQSRSKAVGVVNLVLVAADFPNFVGTSAELNKIEAEVRNFNTWLAFQSNGRLTANWQFPKKWLRLPRNAAEYGVVGFNPRSHDSIVSDVVSAADPDVNFSGIDEMFVYLPDSLTTSEPNRNPFDGVLPQFGATDVRTSEGTIMQVKGSGTVSQWPQYGFKPTLWALWAHDLLHSIGIEGHSPVEAFTLESEDYTNFVMSAWNQFLAGWMKDDQVACLGLSDVATRATIDVDLVPLQLNSTGFRTAIIGISETRAIVVESHRNSGYAKNLGASGILVYLMDTKNVLPYSQRENTASVGSRFLDSTKVAQGQRARVGNGRRSALILPGETTSFENLIIDFVSTETLDRMRLRVQGG
jgi:hypothetical protein